MPRQDPLAPRQTTRQLVRRLRLHTDILVRERCIVDARNDRGRHVLQALEAVPGLGRLHADAADVRVQLLQPAAGADDRPRRAEAGHEVGEAPARLLPDLERGRL